MSILVINKFIYYTILYTPVIGFILYKMGYLSNFTKKYILIENIKYQNSNLILYFLKVWFYVSINAYFVFGIIFAVLNILGVPIGLDTYINERYFILYIFRSFIEFSLFIVFITCFRFEKPFYIILFSYIFLNIYYIIFKKFILFFHLKDFMLLNILVKILY